MAEFWSGLLRGLEMPVKIVRFIAENFNWGDFGQFLGFYLVVWVVGWVVWHGVKRYSDWDWERRHRK